MMQDTNADAKELARFSAIAHRWWDPDGEFKALHDINPLRLDYIAQRCGGFAGKQVVDVGCGGGILAEAMAQAGAHVTGIDLADKPLAVARLHQLESETQVQYRQISGEALAGESPGRFDLVTCLELLEHVPNPASTVAACAALAKPSGLVVFSTINRNAKAYLLAVIGAEYVLRLLPRGTHDYARFLRPAELARWARAAGLESDALVGMSYDPLRKRYSLGSDTAVNYIASFRREL